MSIENPGALKYNDWDDVDYLNSIKQQQAQRTYYTPFFTELVKRQIHELYMKIEQTDDKNEKNDFLKSIFEILESIKDKKMEMNSEEKEYLKRYYSEYNKKKRQIDAMSGGSRKRRSIKPKKSRKTKSRKTRKTKSRKTKSRRH